jgi:hypothetical protein
MTVLTPSGRYLTVTVFPMGEDGGTSDLQVLAVDSARDFKEFYLRLYVSKE